MSERQSNSADYLQISSAELESVFLATARALVLKGSVERNEDSIAFRHDQDPVSYDFSYTLPNTLINEIFFPGADIGAVQGSIEFNDRHRIDDDPDNDGLLQSVYISVTGRMIDWPIYVNQTIRISQDDRLGRDFTADSDVEYTSFDGENLSQKPVDESEFDDVYREAASRRMEARRELLISDVEDIRKIINYVNLHPRQTE